MDLSNICKIIGHFMIQKAVGQVAPQALPDNLWVVPDKGICQGTRFARTLTYLKAIQIAS